MYLGIVKFKNAREYDIIFGRQMQDVCNDDGKTFLNGKKLREYYPDEMTVKLELCRINIPQVSANDADYGFVEYLPVFVNRLCSDAYVNGEREYIYCKCLGQILIIANFNVVSSDWCFKKNWLVWFYRMYSLGKDDFIVFVNIETKQVYIFKKPYELDVLFLRLVDEAIEKDRVDVILRLLSDIGSFKRIDTELFYSGMISVEECEQLLNDVSLAVSKGKHSLVEYRIEAIKSLVDKVEGSSSIRIYGQDLSAKVWIYVYVDSCKVIEFSFGRLSDINEVDCTPTDKMLLNYIHTLLKLYPLHKPIPEEGIKKWAFVVSQGVKLEWD